MVHCRHSDLIFVHRKLMFMPKLILSLRRTCQIFSVAFQNSLTWIYLCFFRRFLNRCFLYIHVNCLDNVFLGLTCMNFETLRGKPVLFHKHVPFGWMEWAVYRTDPPVHRRYPLQTSNNN